MAFEKFLIAPLKTGLQTNLRPWQILDDAFVELQNAYIFRGRLRKRFGSRLMGTSQLLSRLRINLGNTNGSGAYSSTVPGHVFQPGQAFSVGDQIFTVYATGTPAAMLSTGTGSGTYNTSTGAVSITGAAATTAVYFYPGLPVMALFQYEIGKLNNHPTYACDTEFIYIFSPGSGWSRSGTAVFKGSNSNYFWTTNWQGSITSAASNPVLIISNFNATLGGGAPAATDDPMWVTPNGSSWYPLNASSAMLGTGASNSSGFFFLPAGNAPYTGPFVQTARIVAPFKNRLLLLNTVENDNSTYSTAPGTGTATAYTNRCRYSFNGTPFAVNAWYEPNQADNVPNTAAGAGYIDAPTEEQIVSAEFIKDRLIVYFERSTWELAYTGNEVLPFVWQKLNTELGSQSTFSTVPFDQDVLTIGGTGVHACNGSNVRRIDDIIPDKIFDDFSAQASSVIRTVGIRDFDTELVYWAFLSEEAAARGTVFPDQILVYNYQSGSWAINDDCFTTFGYLEQQTDLTWQSSAPITWEQFNGTWISAVDDANERQIVAGTPEGFVLIINADESRNAASMQITNISFAATGILTLTVYNHNLSDNALEFPNDTDFVLLENIVADTASSAFLNGTIWPIYQVVDTDTITINTNGGLVTGTYYGGGTLARVSGIEILTKAFNPYDKKDANVYIQRIDYAVQRTAAGEITIDYYPGQSPVSMIQGGTASQAIMGTSVLETSAYDPILYPLEQYQTMLWHPVYFQCVAESIQFFLYFTPQQMTNPDISLSDFELEGFILYTTQAGRMQ